MIHQEKKRERKIPLVKWILCIVRDNKKYFFEGDKLSVAIENAGMKSGEIFWYTKMNASEERVAEMVGRDRYVVL